MKFCIKLSISYSKFKREERSGKIDSNYCFTVFKLLLAFLMVSPTSPEPAPRSVKCDYILLALPIDVSLVSIEKA